MRAITWSTLLADFLSLALPVACQLCGADEGSDWGPICRECADSIPRLPSHVCRTCGVPRPGAVDRCAACRAHPRAFERARAVAPYAGAAHDLIQRFKYDGVHALGGTLARLLLARDPFASNAYDAIVAVPLAPARLRKRGFNQAALLARGYAAGRGERYVARALARRGAEAAQAASGRAARRGNVARVFRVTRADAIADRRVLLLDDVLTTGATADACARALREAGARRVDVLVVARTGEGVHPRRAGGDGGF